MKKSLYLLLIVGLVSATFIAGPAQNLHAASNQQLPAPEANAGQLLTDYFQVDLQLQTVTASGLPTTIGDVDTNAGPDNTYVFDWASFVPGRPGNTVDWTEGDWIGEYVYGNPTADHVTVDHAPAPGTEDLDYYPSGGEEFDVEAIYFDNDANYFYVAIVTSVPFSGTYTNQVSNTIFDALGVPDLKFVGSTTGSIFFPGDLAIDLGVGTPRDEQGANEFRYDYGVDLVHEDRINPRSYNEAGWIAAGERDFELGDQLYKTQYDAGGSDNSPDPGSAWYTSVFKGFTTGGWSHTNFDPIGTPGLVEARGTVQTAYYEYQFPGGIEENDSPTFVVEFVIPRALFQNDNPTDGSTISMRWVEGCRNDGNGTDGVLTIAGTVDEVEGPSTVSVGDQIWFDANNNGIKEATESGIEGVDVKLWTADATGAPAVDTGQVATTNTEGYYIFDNLTPGDYVLQIAADQFEATGALFGLSSSTGNDISPNGAPDPDTVATDNDDNGDTVTGLGVLSKAVTLTLDGEPIDDDESGIASSAPNASSNRTVDFGFFEPISVGDQVWLDEDNNGLKDPAETGIQGVTLKLWSDTNGDDLPDTDTTLVATTNAAGYYVFNGIAPGTYFIQIPSSNFATGAPLAGLASSTGNGAAPDVDASPVEDDDNGDPAVNLGAVDGVVTQAVTLISRGEPVDDDETGIAAAAPNNSSNKTVDFGFYQAADEPLSLGDQLWLDENNNGLKDASEPGIGNVTVNLWADTEGDNVPDGAAPLQSTTTNAGGYYVFNGLAAGFYIIQIPATNFEAGSPLAGLSSSTGNDGATGAPDPDTLALEDDDNGDPAGALGVVSKAVQLSIGGEPTDDDETGIAATATNANSNKSVDFGFYPQPVTIPLSLGDQVWLDSNNNGQIDSGELGISDVLVKLWLDINGDNAPDQELPITATTDATGFYLFDNLQPGDYIVQIPASEFAAGKPLAGLANSTGNDNGTTGSPDPDNDQNNDDNGDPDGAGGVVSKAVTLAAGSEPTTDTGPSSGSAANEDSNLTVDFGFFASTEPPTVHSLGNYVWFDTNNNGSVDSGELPVPNGVLVELLSVQGGAVLSSTTTVNGFYLFSNLNAGRYQLRLAASNFQAGGSLLGYTHSTGSSQEASPDSDGDQNDNGLDNSSPRTAGILSAPVTIDANEPTGETPTASGTPGDDGNSTPDVNSNLTVDFGVVQASHSLGNYIWNDTNNNGIVDAAETGVPDGVVVELLDDTGQLLTSATTINGYYIFGSLTAGNYRLRLASSNFAAGGRLAGYSHSTGSGQEADPNVDGDQNDNGLDSSVPAINGITSGVIAIGTNEPTLETPTSSGTAGDDSLGTADANSNLTVDFGVVPPATTVSIGNLVWHDADNDGQYNPGGEVGIGGVIVELFTAGSDPATSAPLLSQTTANDGSYNFSGLTPGSYFVYIPTPPSDFPVSSTRTDSSDNQEDNDDNGIQIQPGGPVRSIDIQLSIGAEPIADGDGSSSDQTIDFGFWKPTYSLGNYVWIDSNNNGTADEAESYVPDGVVLELLDGTGAPTGKITETVNGFYLFGDLDVGEYQVRIAASNFVTGALLSGYTHSTGAAQEVDPNSNGDQNDNGLDGSVLTTDGITSGSITIGSNEPLNESPTLSGQPGDDGAGTLDSNSNLTLDFGVVPPVGIMLTIGNLVWDDENINGSVDPGEAGIDGVTVQLFKAGDDPTTAQPLDTQITSGGGLYQFTGLTPGVYFVYIPAPLAPFTGSSPITDEVDNQEDNDDNGLQSEFNGPVRSPNITLTPNNEPINDGDGVNGDLTIDFGFFNAPVAVGDRVWFDEDGNGIFDSGEQGVPNVTVLLFEEGNPQTPLLTTTTFENGFYLFPAVPAGNYFVQFDLSTIPPGYIVTQQNAGENDEVDSDADPSTGITQATGTLTAGSNDLTLDMGITPGASVGDLVWYDTDKDGVQDANETGVSGQTSQVGVPGVVATLFTDGGEQVASTNTNADGSYQFDGLAPGSYYIQFTPPTGFVVSPADVDSDLFDSDAAPGTLQTSVFTLTAGQHNPTYDLGVYLPDQQPASLGDKVWLDTNRDGVQDPDEPGLPGIVVTLFDEENNELAKTTSDSNGEYLFANLVPGTYVLGFMAPDGYLPSPQDVGSNPALDSDADLITGLTSSISVTSGQSDVNWDAGFYVEQESTGSIGDRIWLDANGNGLQDEDMSTAGVPGIVVMLYNSEDQLIGTTTSDSAGRYIFDRLPTGSYYIAFDLPDAFAPSPDGVGTDENVDSDANPTTLRTPVTTITPGENDTAWDLGVVPSVAGQTTATIGDSVWEDLNENGIQDTGEPPIAGVTVKLVNDLGELVASVITDEDGKYQFTNIPPGTYYLEFILPGNKPDQGFTFTTTTGAGGVDGDSDVNGQTGRTNAIVITPGMEDFSWDAGIVISPGGLAPNEEPGGSIELYLPLISVN